MEQGKLSVSLRSELGSGAARRLRRAGRLPAVLYGPGMEPVHLSVEQTRFEHLVATGTRVVDLIIDTNETRVLIKDLQYDSGGSRLLHADFQKLVAGQKVELAVPVELVGEPLGVRRDGGVLDHILKEVTVSCLPGEIPEVIRLDVRELSIGDAITVGQLQWPEGVEPVTSAELTVAAVLPPVKVPEEAVLEEAKEPEVIGRGPTEEEAAPEE